MMIGNYYPETSEGRAEWWENILDHGEPALCEVGLPKERIAAIMADAAWAVYTYGTLTTTAERYFTEVIAFANSVASGAETPTGGIELEPPRPPKAPERPPIEIHHDFESRRIEWVQEVKALRAYTPELGNKLGIEPDPTAFSTSTYRADLHDLVCTGPKTVTGKFRKARGNIDGVILRGRRQGSASWTELGRFKATPFSASVPVSGTGPEVWEFYARPMKRDLEMGLASEILEVPVNG